jgi:UTP:GlnB (protein PII) uridylyltransferase
MAFDLVIDIENTPGSLATVAAAISDAGVNLAAATCIGSGERAELHILVPRAEAAKHSLAISQLAVTREREVVVVNVEDRPGVLADLTQPRPGLRRDPESSRVRRLRPRSAAGRARYVRLTSVFRRES